MAESTVEFCEVGGGGGPRVAYASAGDGPALVMVPGWLSHVTELWTHPLAASALAKLSAGHRFVWYDRLGCGMSDRGRSTSSLDDDVAQLVAVLDAAGIERCDLVGYSFGGPPAVRFAAAHPERVRHLVLYSTYACGADLAGEQELDALVGLVRTSWDVAALTLAAIFLPNADRADLRWFSRFQRQAADSATAADLLGHLRTHDVRATLPHLRVPTTVVTAKHDRVVTADHARDLAKAIPGARLVLVEGNTHDPFIRDAGDVVEAILAAVEGRRFVDAAPAVDPPATALTPRETQVLALLAGGASNKDIAAELDVGIATVERHLTNLYRKLGASGRAQAAVHAVARGLVDRRTS